MIQARKRNWYCQVSLMTPEDWDNFVEFIRSRRAQPRRP